MTKRRLALTGMILAAALFRGETGVAQEDSAAPASESACADAVRARVRCSNPEEVCNVLFDSSYLRAGANLEQTYDIRTQDLGDGTEAHVFRQHAGADAYSAQANFHFVREGDRLALLFDGKGLPASYATGRPRVNGRYQIERVSVADIPGLYRKREVETWFWTGREYAKAFSRVTIEGAKDPKLNGVQLVWNRETEEAYRKAGDSWTYRVQSGDTLSGIAKRFRVSADEIIRQNDIRDARSLRLGQVIRYESWKVNAR